MSGFVLKVKSKAGEEILKNLTPQSSVKDLKVILSALTSIETSHLHLLFGFPPKPLDLSDESRTLCDSGVKSSDTIIVEGRVPAANELSAMLDDLQETNNTQTNGRQGILMKRVVPSDNSCLFTSIGFVLNGKVDTSVGTFMRQIIAEVVSGDPTTYSDAFLGKPNAEYCTWIQNPNSWGGAIEVSVLSRFYGLEMDVVDTLNAIINRFGEDQNYGQRVFLLFDGIHYDPLYLDKFQDEIQTLFPIEDLDILNEAEQLAREAKSARQGGIQYTI